MKRVILLSVFAFSIQIVKGQAYSQLRDSAMKSRERKDFTAAFQFLSKGISIAPRHPYHTDIYDAAALAALTGLTDTAYFYLHHLVNESEYDMITCDAKNDPDFLYLQQDSRWGNLLLQAYRLKSAENIREFSSIASCVRYQDQLKYYTDSILSLTLSKAYTGQQLLKMLSGYKMFPLLKKEFKRKLLDFAVKINDDIYSFYTVQLPDNYNPAVPWPVLVVLHGAVFQNAGFPTPRQTAKYGFNDTTGMNQYFSQFGYRHNTIVVFPHANREFNWMYPEDGFPMILNIMKDMKRYFNIADNKVFLSGHSNGATGVISYLLKSPGLFAGFYGFNSNPRIRTGGTFIRNVQNRSYFNVATDKDYYFPVSGHDTLAKLASSLGLDWQNHAYHGFPHWFPQFIESIPAFDKMFSDMQTRRRNSFHPDLYWECDDTKYGRCDWLSIEELDTSTIKKNWQSTYNFPVTNWIDHRDTSKVSDTVIMAFDFSRLSGAVSAHYKNNQFTIQTSRVKKISIFLSPQMINLSKPVIIYVNGIKKFEKLLGYNNEFMIDSFKENFDREVIWVNYIRLEF